MSYFWHVIKIFVFLQIKSDILAQLNYAPDMAHFNVISSLAFLVSVQLEPNRNDTGKIKPTYRIQRDTNYICI